MPSAAYRGGASAIGSAGTNRPGYAPEIPAAVNEAASLIAPWCGDHDAGGFQFGPLRLMIGVPHSPQNPR